MNDVKGREDSQVGKLARGKVCRDRFFFKAKSPTVDIFHNFYQIVNL